MTPPISLCVLAARFTQAATPCTALAGRADALVHAVPRRRLDRRGPRQSALFNYRLPDLVAGVHQRAPHGRVLGGLRVGRQRKIGVCLHQWQDPRATWHRWRHLDDRLSTDDAGQRQAPANTTADPPYRDRRQRGPDEVSGGPAHRAAAKAV